ncbi:MAG: helix-turn-helix domain-containing protein [Clostridia bacterium]|nr:helix-turn-helix domain-containing protein [Clostridia bacterium]
MTEAQRVALGLTVSQRRQKLGYTTRQAGKLSGTSASTISRLERGEFDEVDASILLGVATALRLDPLFLYSLNGLLEGSGADDKTGRIILRGLAHMTADQKQKAHQMLKNAFPDAFLHTETEELDAGEADAASDGKP